jgi:hypothetical protein
MASYDYARGDLLEQRNSYTYPRYRGPAFLDAWRSSRDEALQALPSQVEAPGARAAEDSADEADGFRTEAVLEKIMAGIETGESPPELEALLRRFEIAKRIHGAYTERWKPREKTDYRALGRYVRFAEVLDRAYGRLGDLRHLSALMKCLDTLVALRSGLEEEHAARLARLLHSEKAHVEELEEGSA